MPRQREFGNAGGEDRKSTTKTKKKRSTLAEEAGPYKGLDLEEGIPLACEKD